MYTGDPERDGGMLVPPEGRKWDVLIDAIDDVPTKANLISYCAKNNIRVISCMGAGGKAGEYVARLFFSITMIQTMLNPSARSHESAHIRFAIGLARSSCDRGPAKAEVDGEERGEG